MAQNERLKLDEYKSIDTEARSRRNNLIFRGHPENVENDDWEAISTKMAWPQPRYVHSARTQNWPFEQNA